MIRTERRPFAPPLRSAMHLAEYKRCFDIFICGGTQHFAQLRALLPKLMPYGTVHLASSFLSEIDLHELHGLYDVLHMPRHSPDGYHNFELFSIRDINRLAAAPWFIKLDADVDLDPAWIGYVEESIAAHPDAVLFGPRRGNVDVDVELHNVMGRDIRVHAGKKVIGGFYVGRTSYFKEHLRLMDELHATLAARAVGTKFRGNEDTLRSLLVHATGAGDRLHVRDSGGRIRIEGRA